MWCVIPAAGRATRFGQTVAAGLKVLLPVAGRPLLAHLLDRLGPPIRDICLVVPPGAAAIADAFGDRWRHGRIHYAVQEQPLGVAHAVGAAADLVEGPFAVVMGDCYYDSSLVPALGEWERFGSGGAVLVEPFPERSHEPMGLVEAAEGRVTAIRKDMPREDSRLRVCGAFFLPPTFFEALRDVAPGGSGEQEIEDVVTELMRRGVEFRPIRYRGWRCNVNTPEGLEVVRRLVAAGEAARADTGRSPTRDIG